MQFHIVSLLFNSMMNGSITLFEASFYRTMHYVYSTVCYRKLSVRPSARHIRDVDVLC